MDTEQPKNYIQKIIQNTQNIIQGTKGLFLSMNKIAIGIFILGIGISYSLIFLVKYLAKKFAVNVKKIYVSIYILLSILCTVVVIQIISNPNLIFFTYGLFFGLSSYLIIWLIKRIS